MLWILNRIQGLIQSVLWWGNKLYQCFSYVAIKKLFRALKQSMCEIFTNPQFLVFPKLRRVNKIFSFSFHGLDLGLTWWMINKSNCIWRGKGMLFSVFLPDTNLLFEVELWGYRCWPLKWSSTAAASGAFRREFVSAACRVKISLPKL